MATQEATETLIQPPEGLLREVTHPTTKEQGYAFPLQTEAWLKMQAIVAIALAFPLSKSTFGELYGSFNDEGAVESALTILNTINTTASKYGDPQTLISSLKEFASAEKAPSTIYGNAVWLSAQTQIAAQQIRTLLEQGLKDIGENPDPQERIKELTELLTGQGGVSSYATALKGNIESFQTLTGDFYSELNGELAGPTGSLQAYLKESGNILADAKEVEKTDASLIEELNKSIKKLNEEYIGFTVAASVSPVLFLVPFFGPFLVIADATTFGVLATKVKEKLEEARKQVSEVEADDRKKLALVSALEQFNQSTEEVETDGQAFLDALGKMIGGWTEFAEQVELRLKSLTVADVENWSAFMTKLGFEQAVAGWKLVEEKSEQFYQTGFVQFSTQSSI